MKIMGVVLLIASVLAGGWYVIHNTVVCEETWTWHNRAYQPPYTYTTMECWGHDDKGNCNLWLPQTHHVPEVFYWIWRDCLGETHNEQVSGQIYALSGTTKRARPFRWKECPCPARREGW